MPKEEIEEEYNFGDGKNEDEYDLDDVKGEYNMYQNRDDEYDLEGRKEDEYDLEDKKNNDEFNIESKGLDEFMTSVKQSAGTSAGQAAHQYNTAVPKYSNNPPAKINDFPLFDDFNPPRTSAPVPITTHNAGFGDEFDDLFGDRPAIKPTATGQYSTAYNQPAAPASAQFDSYYATYQQPSTAQNAYNPYPPQSQIQQNAPKASPFDQSQSSHSGLRQNPPPSNDSWF
eukprot:TRINITY_DN1005_c0_g1_i5.p1 TRINITY_DN1005_c0_g1~~TRINITY_DN1005_c0_g1_i5.p1  ORF type:complete len:228 (-),score=38.22 TRINITY_DN1005_c0_g1_i5:60-743(-)